MWWDILYVERHSMSLHWVWMLSVGSLLVVGTLGCGDKPAPVSTAKVSSSRPCPLSGDFEPIVPGDCCEARDHPQLFTIDGTLPPQGALP
jgi:hypothetical protein